MKDIQDFKYWLTGYIIDNFGQSYDWAVEEIAEIVGELLRKKDEKIVEKLEKIIEKPTLEK